MRKKFTFLTAALALLAFLAIPMGMRGQTTVSYGWETSDDATQWTITDAIVATSGQGNTGTYAGKINTNHTYVQFKEKVYVTSFSFAFKRTSNNSNYNVYIETSTDGNTWNAVETYAMSSFSNGSYSTKTHTFDGTTEYYVRFHCYNTTAVRYVDDVSITYNTSAVTVALPTFSPEGGSYTTTQIVTINCETEGSTIYYTTNGSTPDNTSTQYDGAITVSATTTINAIAYVGNDASSVATATYTIVNLEHAGTEADPYSVADARTAIDANVGVTGVYATGIVSEIVTAYNSNYGNITFDIVDELGNTATLRAYRCGGTEAANVAVNDVVVVSGNLTKYNSIYEFAEGCQLVSLTHPAVSVEAPTFNPAAGTYADAQTVTIICETSGATIYYTTDGTDPTNISTEYTTALTISTTTTVKAIAYVGTDASTVATANYYFCSADNPYTVTEALAFQDYQYPANGIYVEGIVSTAPTQAPTSNGELTYYISVDGEATNQLEVYKGKGLEQAAFTSQDDIQVGDIVTIYGNVQVYNGTIEFGSGNYLVSFERPQIIEPSITVTPATVNAPFGGADGTLTVTYENIEDLISFDIQFCDANGNELEGDDPDWILAEIQEGNDVYSVYYVIDANDGEARTAYLKVYTDEVYSNLVTINQAQYVVDYATLPFSFDGGKADIETTAGLTQNGLGGDYGSSPKLKFDGSGDWVLLHFNEQPGELAFDIKGNSFSGGTFTVQTSVDGETYADFATYTTLGDTEHETFNTLASDVRYIKWIYTNKSSGNVALGNITLAKPSNEPDVTIADATVEVTAEGGNGTITVTYMNIEVEDIDPEAQFFAEDGENSATYDWITVTFNQDNDAVYTVTANNGEARTAYFKVYEQSEGVYSNLVTVNQAAPVTPSTGDNYELFSGDLVEGDYLIVYDGGAMNNTVTSDRLQYESVTASNDVITTDNAAIVWHIAPSGEYWTIYSANANAYAASTGAKNKAQMLNDGTDDMALWTVSGTGTYEFVNKKNTANSVNANLRKNGTYGFACYGTGTGGALSLYKKMGDTPVTETYTLTINGYEEGSNGGYYLIASPVTVDPSSAGMTTDDYDLYYFDQTKEKEWQNYKDNDETGHFDLVPGKGYLYAKQATTEGEVFNFTLTGTPYDGNGEVTLSKTDGVDWSGWNLVGNPFAEEIAYIADGRDFYTMQVDGSKILVSTSNTIQPMEGVFVVATTDGETMTFTTTAPQLQGSKFVLNLNDGHNVIDRAIVRFGQGRQLPKLQLFKNDTKVYIPMDGQDYAVVCAEEMGEMPVNFKAESNGTYSLSLSTDNVQFAYLHLIDNLTGNDVDLLQTPSYSFEAKTTDYSQRFKLVFATGDNSNEDNFAFFSNGSFVINNDGDATLQVVDVTGRIVKSESISGCANVSVNAAPGVYMLRLVNGDNMKIQKVVVK